MHNQIFRNLTDLELLALLVWGEARGESDEGKRAVAHLVMNRLKLKRYGKTLKEVILKPAQFSCFNLGDPNRPKLEKLARNREDKEVLDYKLLNKCEVIASAVLSGNDHDNTFGSTNYFNPEKAAPKWAKKMIKKTTIGKHDFYWEK